MHRALVSLLILAPSACATPASPPACYPPAGASAIWADPRAQYIVLGEYHGTNEMPSATAELVCDAARDGEHILVALEFPRSEEAALQAFLAGELDGVAMLQNSRFWQSGHDGRASAAMLSMLQRLRALRAAGLNIEIIAVARVRGSSEEQMQALLERFPLAPEIDRRGSLSDLHMAAAIIDGQQRTSAHRVIFLVGNAHAVIAPSASASWNPETREVRRFIRMHAAAALPRERTLSLRFTHAGGSGYAQTQARAGVNALAPSESELSTPSVRIAPYPSDNVQYDGRIFIGPVSASGPAAQAAVKTHR